MVVHWETSLKPLYVKTVWIDGRRHAILSKDDQVAKATSSTSSIHNRTSKHPSPASSPIESPKLVLNANPLNLRNWEKQKMNSGYQDGYRIERNCFTAGKTEDIIVDRNPLSERVLQWLDLAGRDHIYLGIDDARLYTTHQVADEETKNYKYIEQTSKSNERRVQNRSSRKQMRSHKTYRTEEDGKHNEDSQSQVYPASYVSDNLQNYAKHSVNNENTDSHYPPRMSLSANIISFQDDSNNSTESYEKTCKSKKNSRRISTTSSLSLALRHKFNTEDELNEVNNNNLKPEKQSSTIVKGSLESQYIDMIRKKMSEANYNIKTTKRQLHIFIPSLPKLACDSKESSILTIDDAEH